MKWIVGILFFTLTLSSVSGQHVEQDSVNNTTLLIPNSKKVERSLQDSSKATWNYFINFQTGSLIGCKSCSGGKQITFTTSIVQGVVIRERLRLGIGSGFDSYYGWQVIPLYGSLSLDLIPVQKKNAVVIQFDYGSALPKINEEFQEYGYKDVSAGRMVNTQIGYRVDYHDLKLSVMVGYKYQRLQTRYEYPTSYQTFLGDWVAGAPSRTTLSETLSRLALTVGIGWR